MDQECLDRLEDFLMASLMEMQPDRHLWLAFQPNTLKDFNSQLPEQWLQMVSDMMSRLENNFYVPKLENNLRNASEVFNMTEEIKNEFSEVEVKDTLGVTKVSMTIHATTPRLIPILEKDKDHVIGDAILFAITKTREETRDPNSTFVIMHDLSFETDELLTSIQKK